jgi:hypothetical protein
VRLRSGPPIIVLLALFGAVLPVPGGADERARISLANLAKANGCKGEPTSYVSGYFSPGDKLSGVFWCARNLEAESDRFLIVVVDRHPRSQLKCPSVLRSINPPRQLRILRDRRIPLSEFVVRNKPSQEGPAGKHTTGPVIDTGDDAVGEQWFCHNGAWLVRVYH